MKQVKYNYYFSHEYENYETGNKFTTDYDISIEENEAHRLLEQLMLDFPDKARYFFLTQQEGYANAPKDCK